MLAFGNLLLFAGYTLIYAAVANGGALAANPWQGILGSAYDQPAPNAPGGGAGPGGGNLNPLNPVVGGGLPGFFAGTGKGSLYQILEAARNRAFSGHQAAGGTPTDQRNRRNILRGGGIR